MTPSWFAAPDRQLELLNAAMAWVGTPFRENSAVAGRDGGVSCHNLVAELYFKTGCLGRFDVPRGSARKLQHGPAQAMLAYIDAHLGHRVAKVDPAAEEADPGDLIVLRDYETKEESPSQNIKHCGLVVPGPKRPFLVHVLPRVGVILSQLTDPTYSTRIEAIRRPLP